MLVPLLMNSAQWGMDRGRLVRAESGVTVEALVSGGEVPRITLGYRSHSSSAVDASVRSSRYLTITGV